MPAFKRVSNSTNSVKLLIGDKRHIKEMIKELKGTDERFKSEANAIRYFVHLGITAQTATENLKNSLDNTIVKNSIKEAVRHELSLHSGHIEKLQAMIANLTAKNEENFSEMAQRAEMVEDKVKSGNDTLIKLLEGMLLTGEQALRNMIILRTVTYIFLLGHKTGTIEPGTDNFLKWRRVVYLVHERANQLSMDEVKLLSSKILEANIIKKMANEIFVEVKEMI